ncbi:hypothetical protein QJS04_geneDACA022239 [Acorus gramineus]|uniref:Pre-rRNA-processing protein Ipi1 N-terminal domain-containing protein n=1 Tax=Acorus gramineus TaxID=55184 RepID=A0AAV9BQV9_ACOGR|nr:hypothetical protein QJS04_geneDACA022239 [Acorus gramineus]
MVRSKPKQAPSKKQSRGVDFKKIKRKIGRKLPPPKNATNVQIKSKAIVLPEQSLASDRSGLAVSKKGLTLKELLQQSSHHNPKIRKVALIGIRDLALKFRSEIKIHKLAIIQKVRERICDNDAVIREELHNLLKKVIFPILKEDLNGPLVSSIMAYVFNAMTHLSVDVRLMAFKFFDLVVLNCPSSFLLYAEKVLDNYGDILRNNQIYLQDKSKLKTALAGLVHCLSLLSSFNEKKPSYDQKTEGWKPLHAFESKIPDKHLGISSIINKLESLVPILISCFQELTGLIRATPVLDAVTFDCILSLLQSINLAAEYAIYRMGFHQGLGISYNSQDMMRKTENNVLVLLKKFLEGFPIYPIHNSSEMIDDRYFILNVKITEIFFHMSKWIDDDASLMERFLIFIENALAGQICNNVRSLKMLQENYLTRLVPFIPGLVSQMMSHWKVRLLQAFTVTFKDLKVNSKLNTACLSAIEEMLLPGQKQNNLPPDFFSSDILSFQVTWMRELPELLLRLGDKEPSMSKVILNLQLRIGQCSLVKSYLAQEYDSMQIPLSQFFCTFIDNGDLHYGPFDKLPRDCQELAVSCLYYFSCFNPLLLKSLTLCFLNCHVDSSILLRIIEVLHSSFKAGHVQIADQLCFLITIIARLKVFPEKSYYRKEDDKFSNRKTFQAITAAICSSVTQMGDNGMIFKLLLPIILKEMSTKPPLDNMYAMLKMVVMLDSKPTRLPEEFMGTLGHSLCSYLIAAAFILVENNDEMHNQQMLMCQYFIQPCILLFIGSEKLLNLVLGLLDSAVVEYDQAPFSHSGAESMFELSNRVQAVASILIIMHKHVRLHPRLSSSRAAIKTILQKIHGLQPSKEKSMNLEERHRIQCTFDQLQTETNKLHCWNNEDLL